MTSPPPKMSEFLPTYFYKTPVSENQNLASRVRHRGAVPPGLKKRILAEFSQGETEKSDLNPEFRGAGVEAG